MIKNFKVIIDIQTKCQNWASWPGNYAIWKADATKIDRQQSIPYFSEWYFLVLKVFDNHYVYSLFLTIFGWFKGFCNTT